MQESCGCNGGGGAALARLRAHLLGLTPKKINIHLYKKVRKEIDRALEKKKKKKCNDSSMKFLLLLPFFFIMASALFISEMCLSGRPGEKK